jgi:hypothetical protein
MSDSICLVVRCGASSFARRGSWSTRMINFPEWYGFQLKEWQGRTVFDCRLETARARPPVVETTERKDTGESLT